MLFLFTQAAQAQVPGDLPTQGAELVLRYSVPVGLGLLCFIAAWIVSKWANKLVVRGAKRSKIDLALGRFLGSITQYTVLAAGIIAALGSLGIETTSLTALLASAGLAVGFALQGSLGNFASGVMILFFRPFQLGDYVLIAGCEGFIEDIGLFATTMNTFDNETIIIPNSSITGGIITNYTKRGTRRGQVAFSVAPGTDLAQAIEVATKAVSEVPLVLNDPAPAIFLVNIGAASIDFVAHVWCNAPDYLDMLNDGRNALYNAMKQQGINTPKPQLVVHKAP